MKRLPFAARSREELLRDAKSVIAVVRVSAQRARPLLPTGRGFDVDFSTGAVSGAPVPSVLAMSPEDRRAEAARLVSVASTLLPDVRRGSHGAAWDAASALWRAVDAVGLLDARFYPAVSA